MLNNKYDHTTGFLLGLVLALAILFVGLQYNSSDDFEIDETLLDEIAEEMLWNLPEEDPDFLAVPEQVVQTALSDQVSIIEEKPELPSEQEQPLVAEATVDAEDYTPPEPQEEPLPAEESKKEDKVLDVRVVEQLPEFPGGMSAFVAWLTKHLNYPASAVSKKTQGRVVVSFIVNKDGTISNPKIAQSADRILDNEAMRVIRMMPKWKPGIQDGKPCRTMFAVPINFKL